MLPDSPQRAKVSKIPPPLPPQLAPEIHKKALEKIHKNNKEKKTFAQAMKANAAGLLKLYETFPSLLAITNGYLLGL